MSTDWDVSSQLVKVKFLDRLPNDHNPLMLEAGGNVFFMWGGEREQFCFKKWCLQKESFAMVVEKACSPCSMINTSLDVWQFKVRTSKAIWLTHVDNKWEKFGRSFCMKLQMMGRCQISQLKLKASWWFFPS